jgi:hypothetical protein
MDFGIFSGGGYGCVYRICMMDKLINRVEVIDQTGRMFVAYDLSEVTLNFQDNEKTLKIYCRSKENKDG